MATTIRSEISKSNPFWLPKLRYLELKNFCLQYPDWKRELKHIDGYKSSCTFECPYRTSAYLDPTANAAAYRLTLSKLIDMVDRSATEADPDNFNYILDAVSHGYTYEYLKFKGLLLSEYSYRKAYRKFFWLLSLKRK